MPAIQCHPAGLRWLNFHADYKRSLKVCSLVSMNVTERGILWLSAEKISRLPCGQLVFFPPSAEHPFASVTRCVHRANKLQTAIIRIKKISPYDTE